MGLRNGEKMSKELRFLLPDLLGKPVGLTNKDGELIFPADTEIPPNSFIFFISFEEWEQWNCPKKSDN